MLLGQWILHLGLAVVYAKIGEVGAGVSPNFFIYHEIILAIRLGDLHLSDVGEIRNCGLESGSKTTKDQKRDRGAFHARAEFPSGCFFGDSWSQSLW